MMVQRDLNGRDYLSMTKIPESTGYLQIPENYPLSEQGNNLIQLYHRKSE